jgi:microcystin-dependent protein
MEPNIGQIQAFGFNFTPIGWVQCIRDPFLGINFCIALFGIFPARN